MNIESITSQENNLLNLIHQYKGKMAAMTDEMQKDGIFQRYAIIHKAYVQTAINENNVEALKRAIFIQWYSLSEPSCFSGIYELDENGEKQALDMLEKLVEEDKVDSEFESMLFHYNAVCDITFLKNIKLKQSLDRISEQDSIQKLSKYSFENRGQMGEYWRSVIGSSTMKNRV